MNEIDTYKKALQLAIKDVFILSGVRFTEKDIEQNIDGYLKKAREAEEN